MADRFGKQLTSVNALLAGFKAGMPAGAPSFLANNTSYTQATILTLLESVQSTLAAVPAAQLVHEAALQARDEADAQNTAVIDSITSGVRGAVGSSPTALAPYGLKPRKDPEPLTAEQNVEKAAKALATRKARGTLGKKQKAAIHGTVTPPATGTTVPATPALATPAVATPAVTPKGS